MNNEQSDYCVCISIMLVCSETKTTDMLGSGMESQGTSAGTRTGSVPSLSGSSTRPLTFARTPPVPPVAASGDKVYTWHCFLVQPRTASVCG